MMKPTEPRYPDQFIRNVIAGLERSTGVPSYRQLAEISAASSRTRAAVEARGGGPLLCDVLLAHAAHLLPAKGTKHRPETTELHRARGKDVACTPGALADAAQRLGL